MQPLNAIDAVAPAFTRTHHVLFNPFHLGRSWKLAASSYIGWAGSMFLPLPLFVLLIPGSQFGALASFRTVLLAVTLVVTLVGLVILYFCARMELVVFEMVVTSAQFIAPMWRRYAARIWPWLGCKVLVGTVYSTLIALAFFQPIRHLVEGMIVSFTALQTIPHGAHPDPEAMQAIFAPLLAQWFSLQLIGASLALLLKIPSTLLNDFVLPFYVLEQNSLLTAIRRSLQVFQADPLHCVLYLILKPILFFIGYIMSSIALTIGMIPIFLVGVLLVVLTTVAIPHNLGGGLLVAAAAAVAYLLAFVLIGYLSLFVVGYLLTLLEAYAIFFLGGRYPLLGNMLEPDSGAPFTPPPLPPSQEELDDEDDGPPMPMDPAVA